MDWRSIGASFTPALEEKKDHVPAPTQSFVFSAKDDDRHPPKYERWQYIVGIVKEDQDLVLEKLQEATPYYTRHNARDHVMAISDNGYATKRYYACVDVADEAEVNKERVKSFKNLSLNPRDIPSVDLWLKYIKAKGDELIIKLQNNQHDIPEWMLPRLTKNQDMKVISQSCELLHKMSNIYKHSMKVEWRGKQDMSGIAFIFTIFLFYKKLIVPDFEEALDAVKWMKTWSNDYIRINELRHEIPVDVHQEVSIEPVYWNYVSSVLMAAKMVHGRFMKVITFFFNHLTIQLERNRESKEKIQKCIIILLTECLIPHLLMAGYTDVAVNLVRNWLAVNLYKDNRCSNFGNLGKHFLLYDLASLQGVDSANKNVFMDLCDVVDGLVAAGDYSETEVDMCRIKPISVEELPVKAIRFDGDNLKELHFRLLELFGSQSLNRLSSNSRWYNFSKAFFVKSESSRRFLTLMLLHSLIAMPKTKILYHLLMDECSSNEISKKVLQLNMDNPGLWKSYAMLEKDQKKAKVIYNDAIGVFPHHVPLLLGSFMNSMECSPENVDKPLEELREVTESMYIDSEDEYKEADDRYEEEFECMMPSRRCAEAVLYTVTEKNNLSEKRHLSRWKALVAVLKEYEACLVLKVICNWVPVKQGHRLAEHIVKLYGNNEEIVATYVKYAIGRASKSWIKHIIADYTIQSRLSIATRHLECFTRYAEDTLFDWSSTRLMLLCRVDDTGEILTSIFEDPMPFRVPHVRALLYILGRARTKYNPVELVTQNCPASKALWLKLTEHLPTYSHCAVL